jgi:hypothetical protein
MKIYCGIGSRETPQEIGDLMTRIAAKLESMGRILRSGGADGADTYFENGVKTKKEIYLPWQGFNGRQGIVANKNQFEKAEELAKKYHPAWEKLTQGARKLMARNGFQVLGLDLDKPANYVICWTIDGKATGGTGQAIRIAEAYNIPVYNLFNTLDREKLEELV